MKPSYHNMSVCGPHHTEAIIKVSCCTYVTRIQRSIWAVFTLGGRDQNERRLQRREERDKLGRGTLMS